MAHALGPCRRPSRLRNTHALQTPTYETPTYETHTLTKPTRTRTRTHAGGRHSLILAIPVRDPASASASATQLAELGYGGYGVPYPVGHPGHPYPGGWVGGFPPPHLMMMGSGGGGGGGAGAGGVGGWRRGAGGGGGGGGGGVAGGGSSDEFEGMDGCSEPSLYDK